MAPNSDRPEPCARTAGSSWTSLTVASLRPFRVRACVCPLRQVLLASLPGSLLQTRPDWRCTRLILIPHSPQFPQHPSSLTRIHGLAWKRPAGWLSRDSAYNTLAQRALHGQVSWFPRRDLHCQEWPRLGSVLPLQAITSGCMRDLRPFNSGTTAWALGDR
jgi:hypothetical protein